MTIFRLLPVKDNLTAPIDLTIYLLFIPGHCSGIQTTGAASYYHGKINKGQNHSTIVQDPPLSSQEEYSQVSVDNMYTGLGWSTPNLERWYWPECGAPC